LKKGFWEAKGLTRFSRRPYKLITKTGRETQTGHSRNFTISWQCRYQERDKKGYGKLRPDVKDLPPKRFRLANLGAGNRNCLFIYQKRVKGSLDSQNQKKPRERRERDLAATIGENPADYHSMGTELSPAEQKGLGGGEGGWRGKYENGPSVLTRRGSGERNGVVRVQYGKKFKNGSNRSSSQGKSATIRD